MKHCLLCAVLLLAPLSFGQRTYSTNFPLTESPISDGGNWISAGTSVGTGNSRIHTASGHALGLECVSGETCQDSTAVLLGVWGADQTASGTVFATGLPGRTCGQEVELRLNTSMVGNQITGYEFDYSVNNGSLLLVRWNGIAGNYAILAQLTGSVAHNGDLLKATSSGGTLNAYKNGQMILSARDTTYTAGSPGIGTNFTNWPGCDAATEDLKYGFSAFSASGSGGQSNPAPPTGLAATVN